MKQRLMVIGALLVGISFGAYVFPLLMGANDETATEDGLSNYTDEELEAELRRRESTDVLKWNEVDDYYDEYCTVEGVVVKVTEYSNTYTLRDIEFTSATFTYLFFGPEGKSQLTVIIELGDYKKFHPDLKRYYQDRRVRVSGKIYSAGGGPRIQISSPTEIEVLE